VEKEGISYNETGRSKKRTNAMNGLSLQNSNVWGIDSRVTIDFGARFRDI
jgi:hypothetical protein